MSPESNHVAPPRRRQATTSPAPRAPVLHCPIAPAVHPEADRIQARSVAWARRMGLAPSAAAEARLEAAKIGWLVARAYPDGALDPIQLSADWTTFFCLLDDRIERLQSPSAVVRALAELRVVLHDGELGESRDPMHRAAADIQARLAALATPAQCARFEATVQQLFEAFGEEAEARAEQRPPPVPTYLRIREITVGIHVEIALGEIALGLEVGEASRAQAARLGLARRASNLIAWANDVYTYEKEMRDGDPNNLVIALVESEGLSLGRAVARVVEMHDAEARAFDALTSDLPGGDDPLGRYASMLRAWVRGHLDWGRETGRYRPARSA